MQRRVDVKEMRSRRSRGEVDGWIARGEDRLGPNRHRHDILPGAICRYVHLWQPFLPSLLLLFPVTLGTDRGSSPSTPSDAFAASPRSTYLGVLLSHSLLFCHMIPCMRLFPHVVLIIYTFSISRLFFSQLFRSDEVFISPPYPLICTAGVSPECFTHPLSPQISELDRLDPAKTSLGARSARLFSIINHHVNPPKKRLCP